MTRMIKIISTMMMMAIMLTMMIMTAIVGDDDDDDDEWAALPVRPVPDLVAQPLFLDPLVSSHAN